jgi:hypothetical protein
VRAPWLKTSHCAWDRGDERIVRLFCPRIGGTVYRRFNGRTVVDYKTLEAAQHG